MPQLSALELPPDGPGAWIPQEVAASPYPTGFLSGASAEAPWLGLGLGALLAEEPGSRTGSVQALLSVRGSSRS